jgi:pyruvate,water dikinase
VWFGALGMGDVSRVGGKNASLGEMIAGLAEAGVKVPGGFATTAGAYREFLRSNALEKRIAEPLGTLNVDDVKALSQAGAATRKLIEEARLGEDFEREVREAYATMANGEALAVAVRSSATAEDLPEASFAGQQETFLNVRGADEVISALKAVYASLFNDRAIAYRTHQGFPHEQVALSVGVQRMVRADTGSAGVIFTLDTESGFEDVVFITSSFGLGEMVVLCLQTGSGGGAPGDPAPGAGQQGREDGVQRRSR